MNLKKWLLVVTAGALISACSTPIITYEIGGKKKNVYYKDVKELVDYMATSYPQYLQDITMLKNVLFSESPAAKDIILFEELQQGLSNSADFAQNFDTAVKKQYYTYLAIEGTNWVAQRTKNISFPVVKASHILFVVNTNQTKEEVKLLAQNTLDTLKKSKSLPKDFSNAAVQFSQDPGSKNNAGDLGYFIQGMMVPDFENAVFSAKQQGLLPELVETEYGYHIIYITEPKNNKPFSWIEKQVNDGKMSYYVLLKLQQDIQQKSLEMGVKDLYVFTNNKVVINKTEYDISAIPDSAVLFTVWNTKYTWRQVKDLFSLFIPEYEKEFPDQFESLMRAVKGFLINVEAARKQGKDNASSKKKVYNDALLQYAMNSFEQKLYLQASTMVTDKDVLDFYTQNKARFVGKDGTPLKFDDTLKQQIRNQLIQNRMWFLYQSWLEEKKNLYKVSFNQNGLNDLLKRAEKVQAKNAQNQPQ